MICLAITELYLQQVNIKVNESTPLSSCFFRYLKYNLSQEQSKKKVISTSSGQFMCQSWTRMINLQPKGGIWHRQLEVSWMIHIICKIIISLNSDCWKSVYKQKINKHDIKQPKVTRKVPTICKVTIKSKLLQLWLHYVFDDASRGWKKSSNR
jgi:hypothetical protein